MSEQEQSPLPMVSIGMPVYNGEKHIRDALDSLLAQTFTDFELIISDNASTDNTGAICQEYAVREPRIRYVRQNETSGVMANFQFVLDQALGEYFMWAATDDMWGAGWLTAMVEQLGPADVIAFSSLVIFSTEVTKGTRVTLKSIEGPQTLRMLRCYFWSEWGSKANAIYGLYRSKQIREIATDVFDQSGTYRKGLDNLFVFTALRVGSLHIDPTVTFYKRARPGGPQFRQSRLFTWRRVAVIGIILFKLDFLPYLLDHIRRAPPGVTRCAVLAATPIKYAWILCRGTGPTLTVFKEFIGHVLRQRSAAKDHC
jgi:glycosyltransferase involved in cell wall biosynthesis